MACLVNRNTGGQVINVKLQDGQTSILFNELVSNAQIDNQQAFDFYNNIYSKKFKKSFGNWEVDTNNTIRVYRAGELKRVNGKFGNAMYFAGTFNHSLQFGSPESYLIDKSKVKDYGDRLAFMKAIADFHEINTVPTKEQTNEFLESRFNDGEIVAVELIKGRKEYLLPSSDFLDNGINHSITYKNGEPKLFYLTPSGQLTDNYKEALNNTTSGKIKVGFITSQDILNLENGNLFEVANNDLVVHSGKFKLNNKEAFMSLMTIDSNSNPTTKNGFINYGIRRGIVSPTKALVGDTYFLKGYGELDSFSQFNAQLVAWEASANFGKASIKVYEDGTFELQEDNKNIITVVGENGANTLSKEDLKKQLQQGKFRELANRYDGFVDTAYTLFREDNELFNNSAKEVITEDRQKDLRIILLNTLSKLGVSVTSISDYIDNFNQRESVDPSVEALADIANNVVAFAQGRDTVDNLSEETSHFIIEAFEDQELIEQVLPQVENTAEWKEHNGRYYEKYSETYSGVELDRIVRKEILGKVLKNKIQDRFSNENATQEEVGLFSALKQLWDSLLATIRGLYSAQYRQDVDAVLNEIADKVLDQEIHNYFDASLLKDSKFTLYSLNDKKALVTISKARQQLEKRLDVLKKSKDVSAAKVQQDIKKLGEAINNLDEWHGVRVIISAIDPQVKSIKKQLEHYRDLSNKDNNQTAYFNQEEQQAFRSLSEDFLPILEELRSIIDKELEPVDGVSMERTLNQMDSLIKDISQLKGDVKVQGKKDIDAIFNRIASQYGLTEDERSRLEALIERDLQETSWFQRNFGSLEHASNPFLGMLGKIINENNNKANSNLLRNINPFLKRVDDEGWTLKRMEELLEKGLEGGFSGFTKSPYLWAKFKADEKQAEVNAFNEVFGQKLDVEQYTQGIKTNKIPRKSDYTTEELSKFNKLMAKWYEENTERRYNKEFYAQKEQLYKDLEISQDTIDFLQNLSIRRYFIMSKYITPEGQLDYSNVSARDRQQLAILTQERKAAKSIIDAESGERKTGIDLGISEDLKKLDTHFQENKKDFAIKDSFYETLEKIEQEQGSEAAFEWLKVNGGIVFNDNFWNSFKQGKSTLVEKLNNIKEEIQEESLEDYDKLTAVTARLEELLEKKTEILKQYQVANNPSEVDFDNMSGHVQSNIKDIETELQTIFRDINSILRRYEENEVTDPVVQTESTVNESYAKALDDSSQKELDFILSHVTENDVRNIREVERRLEKIKQGSDFVDKMTQRFLENYFGQENMTIVDIQEALENEDLNSLTVAFGKTRLLPYFKRFAPQGYDTFLNELKTGKKSISEFVNEVKAKEGQQVENPQEITDLLSISTQFSWTEDEAGSSMLNPDYNENFEGGIRQPKLSKYLDDSFFQEFGIDKSEFRKTKQLNATRNQDKFSMLEELWDIKRKGLNAYNEAGTQNIYRVPQVSKGLVQRTKDFLSKSPAKTVGNSIKDIIYNRVDDLGYGERINGEDVANISDMRLIPKYYLRDLEEVSDISTELAYSYSLYLQAAYTYEQRLNTVSDAMVLEQKLLDSRFVGGKHAETTEAYKMFKNFMDAYFFGIKRSRKFMVTLPNGKQLDVSKMAITFDKFVRYVNIGFSLPIAATSLVSAEIFLRIENYIGEHTNKNSAGWATKEFAKLAPKFINEIGKINRDNKLYQLGERFRVFDITDRTASSGFNRIIRASNQLPYKFSEIANFPIAPRIMLTILDDFRLVDGKFMDFNSYKKRSEVSGLNKKEIVNKWNEYRDSSMYNLLESKNGVMEFNQETVDQVGQDYLDEQLSRVQNRIIRVNANVDSVVPQEDKSAATRDFLMNFMTAHRGWLSIAIQRKFKKAHFNFATGQFEEGHHRTLGSYIKNSFSLMEEKNLKAFIKAFKENWHTLDDYEKRNLRRIMAELGVYMTMLGFGIIVAAIADDDDNKDLWALQFASYIYFRATSEVGSVQAPTGVFGLVDTVQAPFIAINSVKEILDVKGWSLDEVQSGAYEGHSRLYRKLAKQTWLRHLYDLKGVKKKSDYYRLLNSETLFTMQK